MRHTRAHTANRRSHHALKATGLTSCTNCAAKNPNHTICKNCGFYKGRQVTGTKIAKVEKKQAKAKAKTAAKK